MHLPSKKEVGDQTQNSHFYAYPNHQMQTNAAELSLSLP